MVENALLELAAGRPCQENWESIVGLIEGYPKEEQGDTIEAIQSHLELWPPYAKVFPGFHPEHACWKLAGGVSLRHQKKRQVKRVLLEIRKHPHITHFDLGKCQWLEDLDMLSSVPLVTGLDLVGCISLNNTERVLNFPSLRYLSIDFYCQDRYRMIEVERLPKLEVLHVKHADFITEFDSVLQLKDLKILSLESWPSLPILKDWDFIENLEEITLKDCDGLETCYGLERLLHLRYLDLRGCTRFEPKPDKELMTSREEVEAFQKKMEAYLETL